jgi:hypothetical protein
MQAMKRFLVIALKALFILAATGGILVGVFCIWILSRMPRASAMPNSFIIVETYGQSNSTTPVDRVYLESPSSAANLRFEGASLKYQFRGVPHPQAAVPLNGVVVTGSGNIIFGATQIRVEDGRVWIDGRRLDDCQTGNILLGTPTIEIRGTYKRPGPLEITLGRNGWYFEGFIHLGGWRIFTASSDRRSGQQALPSPTIEEASISTGR